MNLSDIEEIATQCLKPGRFASNEYYSFTKVGERELACYDRRILDRRVHDELFKGSHITFAVKDNGLSRHVGNMSLFFLDRRQFAHLCFWCRQDKTSAEDGRLDKISLESMADTLKFESVVMHGYIESPLHTQGVVESRGYAAISSRYVKFLVKLAKASLDSGVPVLMEATGKSALSWEQRGQSSLRLSDLTAEQRLNMGATRPISRGVDKLANLLGLKALSNIFNERTLGKVYFLFPHVEVDYGRLSFSR